MWHTVLGKYSVHHNEVARLCEQSLGRQHTISFNKKTFTFHTNRGNWRLTINGRLQLRHKKDITWVLLFAGHLQDEPKSQYGDWPGPS